MNNFPRQKLLRRGFIIAKDYETLASQGKARVKLTDKQPQIDTKPLQVIFTFTGTDRFYAMPKVGDQVVLIMDEQNEDGYIMGSVYTLNNNPPKNSDLHFIEFSDGTKIRYDKREKNLTIDCSGNIIINASEQVIINSKEEITINSEDNIRIDSEKDIILRAKCKIISIEEDICDKD